MSRLPGFSRRSDKPASIAILLGIALCSALAALAIACGGGGDGDENNRAEDTPTPVVTATPAAPEVQAAANRMDCGAILTSPPYISPEEDAWYKANCARFDGPTVAAAGSQQVPIGDKLIIPTAGVNTTISRTTVPESGAMPDPVGYFNAVWYDFSKFDYFGGYANAGNLILSGHVDCARCINGGSGRAVFWGIRNMKAGDTAQYQMANGTVINYVVVTSEALSVNSDWEKIVSSSTADMTLITCTGTFSGGEYNQRHVVALKRV